MSDENRQFYEGQIAALTDASEEALNFNEQFQAIYHHLRRIASAILRGASQNTLNPTALVNEAYVKLALSKEFAGMSKLHFRRVAARAMRQIVIDASRRKLSLKRGEGAVRVTLNDQLEQGRLSIEQLLLLDQLIDKLHAQSSRQAEVVELRFYGGLTNDEIASELGISIATVERDWKMGRAWLNSQLGE